MKCNLLTFALTLSMLTSAFSAPVGEMAVLSLAVKVLSNEVSENVAVVNIVSDDDIVAASYADATGNVTLKYPRQLISESGFYVIVSKEGYKKHRVHFSSADAPDELEVKLIKLSGNEIVEIVESKLEHKEINSSLLEVAEEFAIKLGKRSTTELVDIPRDEETTKSASEDIVATKIDETVESNSPELEPETETTYEQEKTNEAPGTSENEELPATDLPDEEPKPAKTKAAKKKKNKAVEASIEEEEEEEPLEEDREISKTELLDPLGFEPMTGVPSKLYGKYGEAKDYIKQSIREIQAEQTELDVMRDQYTRGQNELSEKKRVKALKSVNNWQDDINMRTEELNLYIVEFREEVGDQ